VNGSFWLTTLPLKAFLYIKAVPFPQKLKAVGGRKAPAIIQTVITLAHGWGLIAQLQGREDQSRKYKCILLNVAGR
jgi:hypothetical protein